MISGKDEKNAVSQKRNHDSILSILRNLFSMNANGISFAHFSVAKLYLGAVSRGSNMVLEFTLQNVVNFCRPYRGRKGMYFLRGKCEMYILYKIPTLRLKPEHVRI